jgi:hypothetical protein
MQRPHHQESTPKLSAWKPSRHHLGWPSGAMPIAEAPKRHKQPPPTSRSRTTTMKSTPPACHHSRPRGEDQPTATSRFDRREHALYTEIAEDEPPLIALTAGAENRRRTSNWKPYSKYPTESQKTYIYPKNYLDISPPIGKRRRRGSGSDWKQGRALGYCSLGENVRSAVIPDQLDLASEN